MKPEVGKKWYSSDLDEIIREKFGETLSEIEQDKKEHWLNDHDGRLAYVIMCD